MERKLKVTQDCKLQTYYSNRAEASSFKLYRVSVFIINNELIIYQIVSKAIFYVYLYYDKKVGQLFKKDYVKSVTFSHD